MIFKDTSGVAGALVSLLKVALLSALLCILYVQHSTIRDLVSKVEVLEKQGSVNVAAEYSESVPMHRHLVAIDSFHDLSAPSPPALPGLKPADASRPGDHSFYGGKGDAKHLGGFTYQPDLAGVSENVWNFMFGELAIKSVMDVGCGMGTSSAHFLKQGAEVLCLEGSSDAIANTKIPLSNIVEHDFSRGPWWPSKTFDAVWCVEFVEHVGRHFMPNYLPAFERAAIVFMTSAGVGGWHHVEVHEKWWWRSRMIAAGFIFSNDLTKIVRAHAEVDQRSKKAAEHIVHGMDVFINPRVAGLPQHRHLFGGKGCYDDGPRASVDNQHGGKACNGVDALPKEYESLLDCFRQRETGRKFSTIPWVCEKNPRLH
jgi:SAM-dependent methyltransferase